MFLSIFLVVCMATYDMKERLNEIEAVAANTPAQVEMKQNIRKPAIENPKSDFDLLQNEEENPVKIFDNNEKYRSDQLNNVEKRRSTIDKK